MAENHQQRPNDRTYLRDVNRSLEGWMKFTKPNLTQKATDYGLSALGKKPNLAARLYAHFHPEESSQPPMGYVASLLGIREGSS